MLYAAQASRRIQRLYRLEDRPRIIAVSADCYQVTQQCRRSTIMSLQLRKGSLLVMHYLFACLLCHLGQNNRSMAM